MVFTDTEKKILLSIYAARQNPNIHLTDVYETLKEQLSIEQHELLTIIKNLEAGGMLTRTGKRGIYSFVLTPEGRRYIEPLTATFSDKLIDAAKGGKWISLVGVLAEYVFKSDD